VDESATGSANLWSESSSSIGHGLLAGEHDLSSLIGPRRGTANQASAVQQSVGRFPWYACALYRLRLAPLAFALALFVLGGCGGTDQDSSSAGSPRDPAVVFLAGDGKLTVVHPDAGRADVHELAVLAPGDPLYRIVLRGHMLVAYGGDTHALDPELRSPPRKLGDSWFFVPSAKPHRVWLAVLDPTSPETVRALATVREVTVDGRVTFSDVHPPGGRWPVAAVGDELVFEDRRGGLELWNPATGEFTRRLSGASRGPGHGDLLAWCEREGLVLHVLDVRSGRDRMFAPPQGFAAFDCWAGSFSSDGETLAIPARAGGYDSERLLALVDLEDGVASIVPGSTVGPVYVFVAWSSGGDRVFVSGGTDGDRRLLQYRLGEPTAVPLAVEVRDFYGMAAR
jgi:hypothetical protein